MATVGHDGVVRCTDVRTGGQEKDGVLKSIQTEAPLTCGSFHHEVRAGGAAAEAGGGRAQGVGRVDWQGTPGGDQILHRETLSESGGGGRGRLVGGTAPLRVRCDYTAKLLLLLLL